DVRMMRLAGEGGVGEEKLAVGVAALGIVEGLGGHDLDRHLARVERATAQVDLGGRALAELAQNGILADLPERLPAGHCARRLRARASAWRTAVGAVPPGWLRESSEPCSESTRFTSGPISLLKPFSVASGSAARS